MKTLSIRDGDIYMDEKGNLASVSDLEATRQQIVEYLKSFRGDWCLDLSHGLPYIQKVFVVGASEAQLTQMYDSNIRNFPEVVGIVLSSSFIDTQRRVYYYHAQVQTIYGETEVRIDG